MFKLRDLLDILKFHISKEFINLARISLELLEKSRDNNLKLEKILSQAGFEDQELFKAVEEFKLSRKRILDEFNLKSKQITELIDKFNLPSDNK